MQFESRYKYIGHNLPVQGLVGTPCARPFVCPAICAMVRPGDRPRLGGELYGRVRDDLLLE